MIVRKKESGCAARNHLGALRVTLDSAVRLESPGQNAGD